MKWVKIAGVSILLVVALFVAYQSFESSMNPRRGHEHESGQHGMSPAMTQMMQKVNKKKNEDEAKKSDDVGADKKTANHTAPHKDQSVDRSHKTGGE